MFTTDIVVAVGGCQTLFEGYNKFTKQTVRICDFMIFKKEKSSRRCSLMRVMDTENS